MAKWIDIIIMIVVGLALFKGFRRGLIREIFSIVGAILAVALAYHFYQELSQHLVQVYPLEPLHAQAIAFIAILVGYLSFGSAIGLGLVKAIRLTLCCP